MSTLLWLTFYAGEALVCNLKQNTHSPQIDISNEFPAPRHRRLVKSGLGDHTGIIWSGS